MSYILTNSRGVFIPTQIINFALTPPHLRFVVVSVVSLFWSECLQFILFSALLLDGKSESERTTTGLTIRPLSTDTYLSAANASVEATQHAAAVPESHAEEKDAVKAQ